MSEILETIREIPGVKSVRELLCAGTGCAVRGPRRTGAAAVLASLIEHLPPLLVVCEGPEYAEEFAEDINLFQKGAACHFPALDIAPGEDEEPDAAILSARLSVLRHLRFGTVAADDEEGAEQGWLEPRGQTCVCTCEVYALLQPTCEPSALERGSRMLELGQPTSPHELVSWLVEGGFYSVPQVQEPGQYSLRGGILDVFSRGTESPVRIEFFGDEIDSLRRFDAATQLSSERIARWQLTVTNEPFGSPSAGSSLLSFLPDDALVVVADPARVWERAAELEQTAEQDPFTTVSALRSQLAQRTQLAFLGADDGPCPGAIEIPCEERDTFGPDIEAALAELSRICRERRKVRLFCISPAEQERLLALLEDRGFAHLDRMEFRQGRLNHGALFPALALIPHQRLFGRYRQRRTLRHADRGRPIAAVSELEPGDLVVHIQHGIGRFRGIRTLERNGRRRHHLEIEFADKVRVYVPSENIEMVQRYIGIGGRSPELSKLHGAGWLRAKQKAEQAVEDLAAELLELQALRETQEGIASLADTEWEQQFEAEFPYEETEDQLRAISAVKKDMLSPRPMDRLICGDVGYGKTEVAMRAAFKTVLNGRQVAVLVPTTVLAQQHWRTFRERMADYPVRVEMLSRFLTDSQASQVLDGMAGGATDIVIGTHRLLQKDIRFKDLGLVVIDEEQRFGVRHKEKLKEMRTTVDVLTLTATPIPRTLHMSLMGLRDISSLQTPPQDRLAIETRVMKFDPNTLRHAILREINRDGQVFMIHNRVQSINSVAEQVRSIVPEAEVSVAHGQMPSRKLAQVMEKFIEGQVQVLLSTTIVENGLDIPNANTIIMNRAELLGLAELHQLRGRVGRYVRKAYAYLFIPADRPITPEAHQRLDAIRRYCQLGAGFDIALRDLELRGAGNILGPQQSGHIAAVGYDLYCQLLERAVRRAKGMPVQEFLPVLVQLGLDTCLPDEYVPTPKQKIEIYRQINRALDMNAVESVRLAMVDRFGPLPRPAENLIEEARVRLLAGSAGIDSVQVMDARLYLGVRNLQSFADYFADKPAGPRLVASDTAVYDISPGKDEGEAALDVLRTLFPTG